LTEADLPEQVAVRLSKLERLRHSGIDAYPVGYRRTATIAEVRARFAALPPDTTTGEQVGIVGRVMRIRDSGKLIFATLRDGTGDLQVMIGVDRLGEQRLGDFKDDVDLGDHLGVSGEVLTSRRGELSVRADEWTLTAKALRPLPDKWHGLTDPETRVRQRYVDLIVNPAARQMVSARNQVLASVRATLAGRGFVEVETPVLQVQHGGAAARPFRTHLNAFDMDVYLRIALELHLKRLVVGGVERVFEIGRIFRNEGVDATHSPEFTMLEAYQAYGDYDTMAELTRALILDAASALDVTTVPDGRGGSLDLTPPWRDVTLHEAVSAAVGQPVTVDTPAEALRRLADQHSVALQPDWPAGAIVLELFEQLVEHTLIEPTFVRDYPVDVRPLTRQHRSTPGLAEAWDLFIAGVEIGVAYSELTDPLEQRRRLTEQSIRAAGGDPEAMQLDEDFLLALEYGMPPTGGLGVGLDRLLMLLTGAHIRDTILFPFVKPPSERT
jgi:lysyl-tRNA synthetase class 2